MSIEIHIQNKLAKEYDDNAIIMVLTDNTMEILANKGALENPESANQTHLALAINHALANDSKLIQQILTEFDDYVFYNMSNKSDIIQ